MPKKAEHEGRCMSPRYYGCGCAILPGQEIAQSRLANRQIRWLHAECAARRNSALRWKEDYKFWKGLESTGKPTGGVKSACIQCGCAHHECEC